MSKGIVNIFFRQCYQFKGMYCNQLTWATLSMPDIDFVVYQNIYIYICRTCNYVFIHCTYIVIYTASYGSCEDCKTFCSIIYKNFLLNKRKISL